MMQIFGLRMKLWWVLVFLIMLQFLSSIKGQKNSALNREGNLFKKQETSEETNAPKNVEKFCLAYFPPNEGQPETPYMFTPSIDLASESPTAKKITMKQCTVADIVLLVDVSESIDGKDFHDMRKFLQDLINQFDVGSDKIRIGLVQYSEMFKTEFNLNDFNAKEDVIEGINKMLQLEGNTVTGQALKYLLDNSFKPISGSRRKVPKIVILITDEESADDVRTPAQNLRDAGVELFVIGVRGARETELEAIASESDVTHIYTVAEFSILSSVLENLTKSVCDGVKQQQEQIRMNQLRCAVGDIVILVDGSYSIGQSNFEVIRRFLRDLVNEFEVGTKKTRIGLVQYSTDPKTEWHLNTFNTKEAVINAVKNLPYKGGDTFTGKALTYLLENNFQPESGSRRNVPKIGILITDGKSKDPITIPTQNLKDAGMEMFAIGVMYADVEELKVIGSEPPETHVYDVADFSLLNTIVEGLTMSVCDGVEQQDQKFRMNRLRCAVGDIVILVDGSWSIGRPNFKLIRTFLQDLVNDFEVGINKTRIGLVQYSTDPKTEWHLNTFNTKEAVISAVANLPYKGGTTLTGKALTYLLENNFQTENRSRSNVPKIGILITDGKSLDPITIPAQNLKDAGVEMFAVGVKKADKKELKVIASEPLETHVYDVADFSLLNTIVEGLTMSVCDGVEQQDQEIRMNSSAVPWVFCVWSSSCNSSGYYNSTPSLSSSPPVLCYPKSGLKTQETPQELETQRCKKKKFSIVGDAVGWGFVVRGSKPCHIQAVDPSGPAAAAGMKVCQCVVSVNGLNVVNLDYRMVSNLILSGPKKLVIEVMEEMD